MQCRLFWNVTTGNKIVSEVKTVYKIKRLIDGQFSSGGSWPGFSKSGKTWNSIRNLNSHLDQVDFKQQPNIYDGCVVVEYNVTIEEFSRYPVSNAVAERDRIRQQKKMEAEQRKQQAKEQREYSEYCRLKKQFEGVDCDKGAQT